MYEITRSTGKNEGKIVSICSVWVDNDILHIFAYNFCTQNKLHRTTRNITQQNCLDRLNCRKMRQYRIL